MTDSTDIDFTCFDLTLGNNDIIPEQEYADMPF